MSNRFTEPAPVTEPIVLRDVTVRSQTDGKEKNPLSALPRGTYRLYGMDSPASLHGIHERGSASAKQRNSNLRARLLQSEMYEGERETIRLYRSKPAKSSSRLLCQLVPTGEYWQCDALEMILDDFPEIVAICLEENHGITLFE